MGVELIIESNTKELIQAYKNKEIIIEEMQSINYNITPINNYNKWK